MSFIKDLLKWGVVRGSRDPVTGGITGIHGPNGDLEDSVGCAVVPIPSGDAYTDEANIIDAITRAGNGGVVVFPPNREYQIQGYLGATNSIIPSMINGNGSTLKAEAQIATTLASGTIVAGTTTINVTSSSGIVAGMHVFASDGAGNFTYSTLVNSVNGNALSVGAVAMASGATISAGATVAVQTCLLNFTANSASQLACEITGFVFDGNKSNRAAGRQWSTDMMLNLFASGGVGTKFFVHHNYFKSAPCDAIDAGDVKYLNVSDNHFDDIFGNAVHPGGSGECVDYICCGNTLKNCYQATTATTPTIINYGHVSSRGALCTSNGPTRAVFANNVIDTSGGFGIDCANGSYKTDFVISGNLMYNCTHGGFKVAGVSYKSSITGNEIVNCGHDAADAGTGAETTQVSGTGQKTSISGNTFINSCLGVINDASDVTITGNYFDSLAKSLGTYELACVNIKYNAGTPSFVTVSGNTIRGPKDSTESTALPTSNTPVYGIHVNNTAKGLTISGNTIVGHRYGLYLNASSLYGVNVSGNTFIDQFNSGGGNAAPIASGNITTAEGVNISSNVLELTASGTGGWLGMDFGTITNTRSCAISGNQIYSAASGTYGIKLSSTVGAGLIVNNNQINLALAGSGVAISAASAGSGCVITNNVIRNSNTTSLGTATTAAGNQTV